MSVYYSTLSLFNISVAPIIGLGIGYQPIIGVVMYIGISGVFPYQFFSTSLYFLSMNH